MCKDLAMLQSKEKDDFKQWLESSEVFVWNKGLSKGEFESVEWDEIHNMEMEVAEEISYDMWSCRSINGEYIRVMAI